MTLLSLDIWLKGIFTGQNNFLLVILGIIQHLKNCYDGLFFSMSIPISFEIC